MSNFIEMTFVDYPRSGYGDYTPKYSRELVNTRVIERIQKLATDSRKDEKTTILLSESKDWRYCANSYDELVDALTK